MSCSIGCKRSLDPALLWLWLWHRPVAAAPIGPLAWELPYAASEALKDQKKKKIQEEGVGGMGNLGLVDANYCIQNG